MADNTNKQKGSAYNQPDYIKPKSKWTKKMTGWTIAIVVIILIILFFVGLDNGWFKTQDQINGKLELEDYSTIEIADTDVEVSDSTIESYLNSVVSAMTTSETVEEGTVEEGDTINIDYTGVLEGEEEPFDGGTAEGTDLELGSGTMIDGFEEQIIGHEIGDTFDIDVTFPDDYSSEDLQGKNATFTITINYKTITTVPELTDELIEEYTTDNDSFEEPITTIEDYEAYYNELLYNSYLESAIMEAMEEKANVVYFNEANYAMMLEYIETYQNYMASAYGIDADYLAVMYGYENMDDYVKAQTEDLLTETMILDRVAEEQGLEVTDEELDAALTVHMEEEAYEGTLDEFKASSDAYVFLVKETEVLYDKVMEYLKGNVVIVETPEEETEEAEESADAEEETDAEETSEEEVTEAEEETSEEAVEETEETTEEEESEEETEEESETEEETESETEEETTEE